ncbi:PRC-barrel domain-containing protein [uncultured Clostridium sp.]|uniref:PRC-barrel domain-containing protein n=1 Tax=uncultured Clostridium sp. TaxID=59620 RepID=UPI0025F646B2|nr:PRC-barrel domain-containing protein [uncultured Clostridium sp.]
MLKSKDFYLKNIYDRNGKRFGVIEDIYIDFYSGKITGFKCSVSGLFSKRNYIDLNDVMEIGEDIIVSEAKSGKGLGFKTLKNMEVIDVNGIIKGVLEDIIIDDYNYCIKGIVISSGLIDRLIKGKEILLLEQCILGDKYILYTGGNNVMFKTMPHNMENKNESAKA